MIFGAITVARHGVNKAQKIQLVALFYLAVSIGGLLAPAAYYALAKLAHCCDGIHIAFNTSYTSIFGLLLSLPISVFFGKRVFRISLPSSLLLDMLAVPILVLQIAGKTGCSITGCCSGVEIGAAMAGLLNWTGLEHHPAQAYELVMMVCILAFLCISKVSASNRNFPGRLILLYYMAYGLERFLVDFVRPDFKISGFPFSSSQLLAGIATVTAAGIYLILLKQHDAHGTSMNRYQKCESHS